MMYDLLITVTTCYLQLLYDSSTIAIRVAITSTMTYYDN